MNNFEKRGDVVYDATTGLTWEGWVRDGDPQASVDAVNAARVGGRNDWRVPTAREIGTLPDLTRMNPAIDPLFTNCPPGNYRSSTPSQRAANYVWAISSIDGAVIHIQPTSATHMRLVCGTWAPPPLVVMDPNSAQQGRVLWKRRPELEQLSHPDAVQYAAQDHSWGMTWRLPTRQEALNRMDYTRTSQPAIDALIFPALPQEPIWTSTPALDVAANGKFWTVDPTGASTPTLPQFMSPVYLVTDVEGVIAPPPAIQPPPPVIPPVQPPVSPVPISDGITISRDRWMALFDVIARQ